ncbi:hypothetical protein Ctob_003621 [Chrysochromulina tobinii]|uniref:Uncharacterized protein n=1 Tax=Chrysochromulina tobinii TaxID=1460289 RepID=A0A0M0JHB4_9EUKA|nr:hypothetical protein Ctob_003621 [Chrysochromulina tobinii]|eukprot:KOO25633.1 hypothetical protein Ctob_003621 [Chrysochromulina sp. CCMP291]
MPPLKKQKASPAGTAALTPKDAYIARLEKTIDEYRCKGSMLIVCVHNHEHDEEDDDDDDEEEHDTKEYTAEDISRLRHILINDSRDKALKKAQKFATCGSSMMFGTSEGNQICIGLPREVKKALKLKTLPERFDTLFALTYAIKEYDFWMNDNECWESGAELETAMKVLAKAWRDLLKRSDAELGIDAEFTRPGIEALLEQLEDDFKGCEPTAEFDFKWRA